MRKSIYLLCSAVIVFISFSTTPALSINLSTTKNFPAFHIKIQAHGDIIEELYRRGYDRVTYLETRYDEHDNPTYTYEGCRDNHLYRIIVDEYGDIIRKSPTNHCYSNHDRDWFLFGEH